MACQSLSWFRMYLMRQIEVMNLKLQQFHCHTQLMTARLGEGMAYKAEGDQTLMDVSATSTRLEESKLNRSIRDMPSGDGVM